MMKRMLALAAALVLAAAPCRAGGGVWKRLEEARPPAEFLRWQTIPWLTDLGEGLRVARQEKRPLLIWASGDDPLERC
jgi:hypothetical protein